MPKCLETINKLIQENRAEETKLATKFNNKALSAKASSLETGAERARVLSAYIESTSTGTCSDNPPTVVLTVCPAQSGMVTYGPYDDDLDYFNPYERSEAAALVRGHDTLEMKYEPNDGHETAKYTYEGVDIEQYLSMTSLKNTAISATTTWALDFSQRTFDKKSLVYYSGATTEFPLRVWDKSSNSFVEMEEGYYQITKSHAWVESGGDESRRGWAAEPRLRHKKNDHGSIFYSMRPRWFAGDGGKYHDNLIFEDRDGAGATTQAGEFIRVRAWASDEEGVLNDVLEEFGLPNMAKLSRTHYDVAGQDRINAVKLLKANKIQDCLGNSEGFGFSNKKTTAAELVVDFTERESDYKGIGASLADFVAIPNDNADFMDKNDFFKLDMSELKEPACPIIDDICEEGEGWSAADKWHQKLKTYIGRRAESILSETSEMTSPRYNARDKLILGEKKGPYTDEVNLASVMADAKWKSGIHADVLAFCLHGKSLALVDIAALLPAIERAEFFIRTEINKEVSINTRRQRLLKCARDDAVLALAAAGAATVDAGSSLNAAQQAIKEFQEANEGAVLDSNLISTLATTRACVDEAHSMHQMAAMARASAETALKVFEQAKYENGALKGWIARAQENENFLDILLRLATILASTGEEDSPSRPHFIRAAVLDFNTKKSNKAAVLADIEAYEARTALYVAALTAAHEANANATTSLELVKSTLSDIKKHSASVWAIQPELSGYSGLLGFPESVPIGPFAVFMIDGADACEELIAAQTTNAREEKWAMNLLSYQVDDGRIVGKREHIGWHTAPTSTLNVEVTNGKNTLSNLTANQFSSIEMKIPALSPTREQELANWTAPYFGDTAEARNKATEHAATPQINIGTNDSTNIIIGGPKTTIKMNGLASFESANSVTFNNNIEFLTATTCVDEEITINLATEIAGADGDEGLVGLVGVHSILREPSSAISMGEVEDIFISRNASAIEVSVVAETNKLNIAGADVETQVVDSKAVAASDAIQLNLDSTTATLSATDEALGELEAEAGLNGQTQAAHLEVLSKLTGSTLVMSTGLAEDIEYLTIRNKITEYEAIPAADKWPRLKNEETYAAHQDYKNNKKSLQKLQCARASLANAKIRFNEHPVTGDRRWNFDAADISTAGDLIARKIYPIMTKIKSDRRLKANIKNMDVNKSMDSVAEIVAKTYNLISDPSKKRWGFIAQEIPGELSHIVQGVETEDSYLSLNYLELFSLIPALCKKVRSLERCLEIKKQTKQI